MSCFTALTETTFAPKSEVALRVYCVAVRSAILATAWLLVYIYADDNAVVYVHNAGHPALYDMATVHVTVDDINDNRPVFAMTSAHWSLDVPENANMAAIHTVEAYDADVGDNARLSYSITGISVALTQQKKSFSVSLVSCLCLSVCLCLSLTESRC